MIVPPLLTLNSLPSTWQGRSGAPPSLTWRRRLPGPLLTVDTSSVFDRKRRVMRMRHRPAAKLDCRSGVLGIQRPEQGGQGVRASPSRPGASVTAFLRLHVVKKVEEVASWASLHFD